MGGAVTDGAVGTDDGGRTADVEATDPTEDDENTAGLKAAEEVAG